MVIYALDEELISEIAVVNHLRGADIAGFVKAADAMLAQGGITVDDVAL